jgi:hypothetical protein
MQEPTWAVVATVDEPAPLIISFAAHHLALGAEVHLFLDRPNPVAEAALAGLPRLHLTVCDAGYWAQLGWRPQLHVGRQTHNANAVYAATKADFLLHCDCDEFLRDGAGLRAELAALPAEAAYLRLQMAERVQLAAVPEGEIFDGLFRLPVEMFDLIGDGIYGEDARFLKDGLTGHRAGKAVVRTGLGLRIGLHAPDGKLPHAHSAPGRLLHFDGLTRLHYTLKLLRRAAEPVTAAKPRHGRPRLAQIGAVQAAGLNADRLKTLTPQQVRLLDGMGYLDRRGFDPGGALARFGLSVDLSAAGFDAELRARDAAFLVASGL